MKARKVIKPVHPGKILLKEFLKPLGITQYRLAKSINVPARRVNEIIKEKRAITADTALRLGLFFDMSASFWLGLQADFEIDMARVKSKKKLLKEVVSFKDLSLEKLR